MAENSMSNRQLDYSTFRKNLRDLIASKGILAKDLANNIQTTAATISRYVTDMRDPELEYVYRIARYFGVSIDWILGLSENYNDVYTPEIKKVADLYSRASADDQAVIQTILRKYDT